MKVIDSSQARAIIKNKLNKTLHPAGVFKWNEETQTKEVVQASVPFNTEWDDKYNIGKIRLEEQNCLLCIDIDGDKNFIINNDSFELVIFNTKLTLPKTFYTQTTKPGKYHLYYKIGKPLSFRFSYAKTKSKVDLFTIGVVFEWHSFSPHNEFYDEYDVVQLPKEVEQLILSHLNEADIKEKLIVVPNIERANIVKKFLNNEINNQKEWNIFFKNVFPNEYIEENKKKLSFKDFTLSYDLINKTAVKLTTTAQLSYDDAVETLLRIVEALGGNRSSSITEKNLFKHILPSLPQHEAIKPYSDADVETLEEALSKQGETNGYKVVRTIYNGEFGYVLVNSVTLEPVPFNETYILKKKTVEPLAQHLISYDHKGRPIFDDSITPIVDFIYDINKSRAFMDEDYRLYLNAYTPTEYIKKAYPRKEKPNNIYTKAVRAVMGEYTDLYDHYIANSLFGPPPSRILWVATGEHVKGGTGKSFTTLLLPSKIAGPIVAQGEVRSVLAGWGDNWVNTRVLSFEDPEKMSAKEFNSFYSQLKRVGSNAMKRLNMKGGKIVTKRVNLSITISSNWKPPIPSSDRWIIAIEPLHVHDEEYKLSSEERFEITRRIADEEYDNELQDYVDYLYYLSIEEKDKYQKELYEEAPETKYYRKWMIGGTLPTKAIVPALTDPEALMSLVKKDFVPEGSLTLTDYLKFIIANYQPDTHKVGLPWEWFAGFVEFVIADRFVKSSHSKKTMEEMLGVEFTTNMGSKYTKFRQPDWASKVGLPKEISHWKNSGYVFQISDEIIEKYKQIIIEEESENKETNEVKL